PIQNPGSWTERLSSGQGLMAVALVIFFPGAFQRPNCVIGDRPVVCATMSGDGSPPPRPCCGGGGNLPNRLLGLRHHRVAAGFHRVAGLHRNRSPWRRSWRTQPPAAQESDRWALSSSVTVARAGRLVPLTGISVASRRDRTMHFRIATEDSDNDEELIASGPHLRLHET